jgi:arsenate reductase (thioredoxin)
LPYFGKYILNRDFASAEGELHGDLRDLLARYNANEYAGTRRRINMNKPKRVLILCTGNSARSQMAEGILRHEGKDAFKVESAGVKPGTVRPEAIQAMREIGIDISGHRSKSVDEFLGEDFDYIITVCDNAKESCPVFPGKARRIHRSFEDPPPPGARSDEETLSIFRRVRDEIREWMKRFITTV